MRSKSFEHSETYSSYEEENCEGHNDQGKYCLRIIDTWEKKKTKWTLELTKEVEQFSFRLKICIKQYFSQDGKGYATHFLFC